MRPEDVEVRSKNKKQQKQFKLITCCLKELIAQEESMQKYTEHMYKEVCPKRTLLQKIQEIALLGKGTLYFQIVLALRWDVN